MTRAIAGAIIPGSRAQLRGGHGRFGNMPGRGDDAMNKILTAVGVGPDKTNTPPINQIGTPGSAGPDRGQYKHIDSVRLLTTPNPHWVMLSIKVKPPPPSGPNIYSSNPNLDPANVGFYIARKTLGTEVVANILRQLDAGDALRSITYTGVRKFARKGFYNPYRQVSRIIRGSLRSFLPLLSEPNEEVTPMEMGELFCSDATVSESDGLIWKIALPVGELKLSPGWNGKPVHKPLRVVNGRSDDARQAIGLEDIVAAFEEGAVQHVTVPLSHSDKVHENTGFVRKVKIVELKDGRQALSCGIEFTEPEIREKVRRGSIANVSVGVAFDYHKKDSGKRYGAVLQHLALTNHPWVPGMAPFGAKMSDSAVVVPLEMVGEEDFDVIARRNQIESALEDINSVFEIVNFDGATVVLHNEETNELVTVPYTAEGDVIALDIPAEDPSDAEITDGEEEPELEVVETDDTEEAPSVESIADADDSAPVDTTGLSEAYAARQALITQTPQEGGDHMSNDTTIELSDDVKAKLDRLEELEAKVRVAEVDGRVEELKVLGLSEYPGFLKTVRDLLLADDGGPAVVMLSEDSEAKQGLTVTDIVNRLVEALPREEEGGFKLSDQHIDVGASAPAVEVTNDVEQTEDQISAARDFLFQR